MEETETAQVGPSTPLAPDTNLYVTESDDGNVLDLIYSDDSGVYVRTDGRWTSVDADADEDPIDGKIIEDVSPDYVDAYDESRSQDESLDKSSLGPYTPNAA